MMTQYVETAMAHQAYGLKQTDRERLLLKGLNDLMSHHYEKCLPYQRIINGAWHGKTQYSSLSEIPYLPVSLFKTQKLQSVDDSDVRIVLTSSGTTGQAVSRIALDKEASSQQQKALANSLMHILGKQRLPMLVIDTDAVFKDPKMMSARGAGVLGIMRYGRNHVFALDQNLQPELNAVREFLEQVAGKPFFMFGFTFMVWMQFYQAFKNVGLDLSQGTLIHSGGWKKMQEHSVDNTVFRECLREAFGLEKIYNFYGMVEQIGSIFLEGTDGLLFPPNYADVIIRNPVTWEPAEVGEHGIVQVVSMLPRSYPGHSLLTEDVGVIEVIDPPSSPWAGKGIRILGRVAKSELRGCSDVIAAGV